MKCTGKKNESQSSSARRLLELLLEVTQHVRDVGQQTRLVRVVGLRRILGNNYQEIYPHLESHDSEYDDGGKHGGCTVCESHDYCISGISSNVIKCMQEDVIIT